MRALVSCGAKTNPCVFRGNLSLCIFLVNNAPTHAASIHPTTPKHPPTRDTTPQHAKHVLQALLTCNAPARLGTTQYGQTRPNTPAPYRASARPRRLQHNTPEHPARRNTRQQLASTLEHARACSNTTCTARATRTARASTPSTPRHAPTRLNTLQHASARFGMIQHAAARPNTPQHAQIRLVTVHHASTRSNTPEHAPARSNTRQHSQACPDTPHHASL